MLILVYFFLWQCVFYVISIASSMPWVHQKHTKRKQERMKTGHYIGSAISFSNHYTIGILKKSAAGRRIGYLAHETCKNFLAPLLSKLSAEES